MQVVVPTEHAQQQQQQPHQIVCDTITETVGLLSWCVWHVLLQYAEQPIETLSLEQVRRQDNRQLLVMCALVWVRGSL